MKKTILILLCSIVLIACADDISSNELDICSGNVTKQPPYRAGDANTLTLDLLTRVNATEPAADAPELTTGMDITDSNITIYFMIDAADKQSVTIKEDELFEQKDNAIAQLVDIILEANRLCN